MMAIFMPTNFKSLSLNHFLKLQNPSQVLTNENFIKPCLDIGTVVQQPNCYISNVVNATPMMTDSIEQDTKMRVYSEDDSNSNDSDLSVGQEKVHNETVEGKINNAKKNNNNNSDDEMSNASSSQYTNSSTRLCSPQNTREIVGEMMRPMQFHEEILRSSQLYAEELLRQRIAAAARLQTVTDPKNHHSPEEPEPSIISKLSFQSNLFSASKLAATDNSNENGNNLFCAKSAINFQNIHSHLSAISQITHNLGSNIKKDDGTSLSSLSRESSQSPSGFQQFKQHLRGTHQNHLHEHNLNLKFSIDNILKADFGRRITEPLLKSSKSRRVARESKQDRERVNSFSIDEQIGKSSEKPADQNYSSTSEAAKSDAGTSSSGSGSGTVWPAWVFCTRYSDRPSSGRSPRIKKPKKPPSADPSSKSEDEKRPRTAFSGSQLARLKHEFNENRYLTEKRRQQLSAELGLNEAQIKIWFQNKRAKIKKSSGQKNPLALQLMAQGLYNHSTVPLSKEEEELQELQAGN